ncbi:putative Band 7 domain-containing protein [Helianthus anomalus]
MALINAYAVCGLFERAKQVLSAKVIDSTVVFVQIISSIQYRVIKQSADDAFYELQNPGEQIQAYVFYAVKAQVPRMTLDQLFEQKDEVAKTVLEELEKINYGHKADYMICSWFKTIIKVS